MRRFSHAHQGFRTLQARVIGAGLAAVVGIAAAACGDDGGTAEPTSDLGDTTATSSGPKATGEPIKLGFVNSEGGAFSVPELRVGNEVAESYINNNLGGVGGRPVEVTRCATDGSPEASIDCANQLVEEGVVAVVEGTDLGGDAMVPILADAGIPLVGHVQFGPARMFDDNSYYFGAAALAYGAAALRFYADEGAESVTWFLPDAPSSHAFTDGVLEPTSAEVGIDYSTVYYDAASPNWSVLAATAVSERPDVSGSIAATDAQCAEMIGALRDAGYQGRILAASCVGLHGALGDDAVGVDTDTDHWNPNDAESAPEPKQRELAEYAAVMRAAGQEHLIAGNAIITFADLINLSRIMATIDGPIDGASVAGALRATKDFDSYAGPTITCDHSVIPGNSACSTDLLFFQVQDDGSVQAVTDDFVDVTGLLG
jgi:branched-chain amino acid transport system substrate-binding protein